MIVKLDSLGDLPYKSYSCFVFKTGTEPDTKNSITVYTYTQKHPACLLVFIDDITNKEPAD